MACCMALCMRHSIVLYSFVVKQTKKKKKKACRKNASTRKPHTNEKLGQTKNKTNKEPCVSIRWYFSSLFFLQLQLYAISGTNVFFGGAVDFIKATSVQTDRSPQPFKQSPPTVLRRKLYSDYMRYTFWYATCMNRMSSKCIRFWKSYKLQRLKSLQRKVQKSKLNSSSVSSQSFRPSSSWTLSFAAI